MNFEKFKENTDLRVKKVLEDEDNGLPLIMAMNAVKQSKSFSLNRILLYFQKVTGLTLKIQLRVVVNV